MTTAKVFKHRGSQTIRLPKEFHVKGKVVYLKKMREGFLVMDSNPWELCREACQEISDKFMKVRVQPRQQRRK
jgi:virulence-associated protein VagC